MIKPAIISKDLISRKYSSLSPDSVIIDRKKE